MLDWLAWFIRPRRRAWRLWEAATCLVLVLAGIFFFCPTSECSCGELPATRFVGTPTDDVAEFTLNKCRICEGTGRVSLYHHWFRKP